LCGIPFICHLVFYFLALFFTPPPTTEIYPLSLHDALPICQPPATSVSVAPAFLSFDGTSSATFQVTANGTWKIASNSDWLKVNRSEEHTSELQSRENLVCRLLLEKKKKTKTKLIDRKATQ